MATASFWNVVELKMNIFNCLREEKCSADLSRCARVSRTWMDLALDALWFGYPGTNCEDNRMRTKAIALLPARRRQCYAHRVGVLDFTDFSDCFFHAMFGGLTFPTLKDVTLDHVDAKEDCEPDHFRLSRYLSRTLRRLNLIDKGDLSDASWLTPSFLSSVAETCCELERLSLLAWYTPIVAKDLVHFFQRTRAREVSLYFGDIPGRKMFTDRVLLTLSFSERLESLTLVCPPDDRHRSNVEEITAKDLQSLLDMTDEPFPALKRLDLKLEDKGIVLMPHCFPSVTQLRLEVSLYNKASLYTTRPRRDESVLEPISKMSQLQVLEIVGGDEPSEWENSLPPRAFIPLGCLTRLKSLDIGKSFFPVCIEEALDTDWMDDSSEYLLDEKFLAEDVLRMFSNLTLLDHLSVNARVNDRCGLLLSWISSCCPQLGSIRFVGRLDLWWFVDREVIKFYNITQMIIEDVQPGISAIQAARLIDNFAPQLQSLSFDGEYNRSKDILTAWLEFQTTPSFFKDRDGSRAIELVRVAA